MIIAAYGHPSELPLGTTVFQTNPNPAYVSPFMTSAFATTLGSRGVDFPAGYNELWISFYMTREQSAGGATVGFSITDNNGVDICRIGNNSANLAFRRNNAGTYSIVTNVAMAAAERAKIDIHVKLGTSDGSLSIYKNGVQVGSTFTGNVNGTATSIAQMTLRPVQTANLLTVYSGFFLSTTDTTGMSLTEITADGDGPLSEWVGDYEDLDTSLSADAPTTSLSVTDANLTQLFTGDFSSLSTETIHAVVLTGTLQEDVTGEAPVSATFRTSSGTLLEGPAVSVGSTWSPTQHVFNLTDYADLATGSFGFTSKEPE